MSTKIFTLKLQGPKAPPKDYILVLNEHLTPDEFVNDLRELYPAIPTTNVKLALVLEGSYGMTPRQFLRYMVTTVAYSPQVKGGVCVPTLLGGGNGVKVVVEEEGLAQSEWTQPIARRQSTSAPSSAAFLAKELDAMKIGENSEPPASTRAKVKIDKTQYPPTHEGATHEMCIRLIQDSSSSPRISFPTIILKNIPQCGGSQESVWLESQILARLPVWLDPAAVKVKLPSRNVLWSLGRSSDSHVTWNEDSFSWSEFTECWVMNIAADISW